MDHSKINNYIASTMALVPSFEDLLLEVHQGLGLKRDPRKKKFADLDMRLQNHVEMTEEFLASIFEALDLDAQACQDAFDNIMEWAGFHKAVELNIWTANASEKQVLWHMLAYSYVPAMARRLAFWSLAGAQRQRPMEAVMSGGEFWFLPRWDPKNGKIELPVPRVIDWVLDLSGASSLQALGRALGGDEGDMRNLANWRMGSTPKSAEMIDALFPDSAVLNFAGADLRDEPSSMRTIRQRLKVARLAQHGYEQLLKALCGDENKLLQLLELFHRVYNLTIAASQHGDTDEAQDAWFEDQIAPWDKLDLLLSITPSCRDTAYKDLAKQLTRKFMTLESDSPLQDLVPIGLNMGPIVKRRIAQLRQQHEEDLRLDALIDRVHRSSPWRALQAEPSYWVISQFAHTDGLPAEIRSMATQRLRELATSPGQTVEALMLDISFLILCEPGKRPKVAQQRVQILLDTVEKDQQGYEEWRAPLLNLRAKHRLMQNDFEGARVDFKDALAACSVKNFGPLRGEVARDGWATEMASVGFIPNNQEIYYRHMLMHGMFSEGPISIEDTAVWCEEYFWNDLYHLYPGVPRKERLTKQVYEAVLAETFGLIETADWDRLRLWIKSHAKQLREANFKDARCDSVLLSWLKWIHMVESRVPAFKAVLPQDMASEIEKVETHVRNRRHAIALLLEAWPEQAKIADFKGQTPLHLVADNGDAELTRLLAPLSDLNAQDCHGRTALHAAASGRSPECVSSVIDRDFQIDAKGFERVTPDEQNTALHTAVRFGQAECVQLILDGFPSLKSRMNMASQTPLVMAIDILQNLDDWRRYMEKNNRCTGSKEDFEAIIKLLEFESQPV